MEMTVAEIARQTGRTPRRVRMAIHDGRLLALRVVGRQILADDLAATAWARSTARGARWSDRTRTAGLELLATGSTKTLEGSALSRLRSALRTMSATDIAHASGGLGRGWLRCRAVVGSTPRIGPSAIDAESLGIVGGTSWVTFVETADITMWEVEHDAVVDGDGDVAVVERCHDDPASIRALLDTYLLGDTRASAAAAAQIEERARAV